ncbi:MAG: rhodanese-like domain-containing protein, partial [Gammaproteobacteria bacterium]|nr:rhodanese-like domain-containing protein [Gammaproteobacteria bacterium]
MPHSHDFASQYRFLLSLALLIIISMPGYGQALEVKITHEIGEFSIKHADREIRIRRNQDTDASLNFDFARTSRPCPPFCAQPIIVSADVKTLGEVE